MKTQFLCYLIKNNNPARGIWVNAKDESQARQRIVNNDVAKELFSNGFRLVRIADFETFACEFHYQEEGLPNFRNWLEENNEQWINDNDIYEFSK